MRKYFILAVIILLNIIKLLSQDIIDPPKLNQLDTLSILQREPDRFVRGWTVGAPGNMLDSAMFINTYYDYKYDLYQGTNKSIHNLLVINIPGHGHNCNIASGRDNNVVFNTQSIYLDPSLEVDTTENFTPRANDISGEAMGFLYRNWELGNRS